MPPTFPVYLEYSNEQIVFVTRVHRVQARKNLVTFLNRFKVGLRSNGPRRNEYLTPVDVGFGPQGADTSIILQI